MHPSGSSATMPTQYSSRFMDEEEFASASSLSVDAYMDHLRKLRNQSTALGKPESIPCFGDQDMSKELSILEGASKSNLLNDSSSGRRGEAKDGKRTSLLALYAVVCISVVVTVLLCIAGFKILKDSDDRAFDHAFEMLVESIKETNERQLISLVQSLAGISQVLTLDAIRTNSTWPYVTTDFFTIQSLPLLKSGVVESIAFSPFVTNESSWESYALQHHYWLPSSTAIEQKIYRIDPDSANLDDASMSGNIAPLWQTSPIPEESPNLINFDSLSNPALNQLCNSMLTHAFDKNKMSIYRISPTFDSSMPAYPTEAPSESPHSVIFYPIFDEKDSVVGMIQVFLNWKNYLSTLLPPNANGVLVLDQECRSGNHSSSEKSLTFSASQENGRNLVELVSKDEESINDEDIHDFFLLMGDTQLNDDDRKSCKYTLTVRASEEMHDCYETPNPLFFTLVIAAGFAILVSLFVLLHRFTRRTKFTKQTENRTRKRVSGSAVVRSVISHAPDTLEAPFSEEGSQESLDCEYEEQDQPTDLNDDSARLLAERVANSRMAQRAPSFLVKSASSRIKSFLSLPSDDDSAVEPMFNTNQSVTSIMSQRRITVDPDLDFSKPIADLFPFCSLVCGQIVGFNAWSSVREPGQVFIFLEELFKSFDEVASQRGIFKVDVIGDNYLAVAGVPEPRDDHAVAMAQFARDCIYKSYEVTKKLEVTLGPDTAELSMRFGIHSGPVTAGILRGEQRQRFQLFGDTLSHTQLIERTGQKGRIHISQDTADLLTEAGKVHWIRMRADKVLDAANDGEELTTFWLSLASSDDPIRDEAFPAPTALLSKNSDSWGGDPDMENEYAPPSPTQKLTRSNSSDIVLITKKMHRRLNPPSRPERTSSNSSYLSADAVSPKQKRLAFRREAPIKRSRQGLPISVSSYALHMEKKSGDLHAKEKKLVSWNVDILERLLKQVVERRSATGQQRLSDGTAIEWKARKGTRVLEEVKEIIVLPKFDGVAEVTDQEARVDAIDLGEKVRGQLFEFVSTIAQLYHDNPFHNFEHASHVLMSVVKLLSRIVAPPSLVDAVADTDDAEGGLASKLHDHTYGITSDPLTQFSVVLSALIHDVDHKGIPNNQLVKENAAIAEHYRGQSVAEQNSVDLSWDILMQPDYKELRGIIYQNDAELQRFRQLVVNSVMATDIVDRELKELRNKRWDKAFKKDCNPNATEEEVEGETVQSPAVNRKATIVIEHIIQASDVSHTMQHWHVYRKWNERFFREQYQAFKAGRAEKDPVSFWYKGEIGFFDFYIIPLAKKLKECGVFGVSSDEYLNYALKNRAEWERKGEAVVAEMIAAVKEDEYEKIERANSTMGQVIMDMSNAVSKLKRQPRNQNFNGVDDATSNDVEMTPKGRRFRGLPGKAKPGNGPRIPKRTNSLHRPRVLNEALDKSDENLNFDPPGFDNTCEEGQQLRSGQSKLPIPPPPLFTVNSKKSEELEATSKAIIENEESELLDRIDTSKHSSLEASIELAEDSSFIFESSGHSRFAQKSITDDSFASMELG